MAFWNSPVEGPQREASWPRKPTKSSRRRGLTLLCPQVQRQEEALAQDPHRYLIDSHQPPSPSLLAYPTKPPLEPDSSRRQPIFTMSALWTVGL